MDAFVLQPEVIVLDFCCLCDASYWAFWAWAFCKANYYRIRAQHSCFDFIERPVTACH